MVLESKVGTESCVYREIGGGLKTQPWGAPTLRMRVDEVCQLTLTTWCLSVRKSRTHMHIEVLELCDQPEGTVLSEQ